MTHVTSYDAATGGNVVNEVKNTYADGGANGGKWGRLTMSEQAHTGAVGQGTPAVEYAFADGASGSDAKFVRLSSVTYPGGSTRRVVYFNYAASGVGSMLSRLDNIAADANGNTRYGLYTYLGAGTIVRIEHPAVTVQYEVDSSGIVGHTLTSQFWYDSRGRQIKAQDPNGLFRNSAYDSAGRQTASFVCYDDVDEEGGSACGRAWR